MKIAFDIRPIVIKGNGIANYTKNIYHFLKNDKNIIVIECPYDRKKSKWQNILFHKWEKINLPKKLKKEKIKLYHSTRELGIPSKKVCKYISTIHDVIPCIMPEEYYPNKLKRYFLYTLQVKNAIKNSDIIITDSNYSKSDIIKHFKVDENKIRVVYLGIDNQFKTVEEEKILNTKAKLNINKKYILGIGGTEYRKNIKHLVEAFELFNKERKNEYILVIVGKLNCKYNIKGDNIKYTGYIIDEDLVALYNGAEVFVYPSLYEGFGLPPLEAMACGTPVVTSNITSIPEIIGDAAELVDPYKVLDIKKGIDKIIDDKFYREKLIQKAYEKIKEYSWEITVEKIKKIHQELVNN